MDDARVDMTVGPAPGPLAGDCRGINFFAADGALKTVLGLYMADDLRAHLEPHFQRLGELAGGRLDDLARTADRHGPVLQPRDRFGNDAEWIEYHPAYREMERLAFAELGMHAMAHRAGVLGWPEPLLPIAKYAFQYLFVQGEFGLMCPVSLADTAIHVFLKYADADLKARYTDRLLSQDPDALLKCSQFMTEKPAGSDVGAIETVARWDAEADDGTGNRGAWRLTGEKWFCSHAVVGLGMVLARPEGAPAGTRGLGLFALPRFLDDGRANAIRIVRLKDKLGTRSMASGEIVLDGAMEVRGGNAYIEDYVEARLLRDAHVGVLWEGTSNIAALDAVTRAVGKAGAETDLQAALAKRIDAARDVPGQFRSRLAVLVDRALAFARGVAADPARHTEVRRAAGGVYHATTAALMAWEAAASGDGRRRLSRLVCDHRLAPADQLAGALEQAIAHDGPALVEMVTDVDLV